MLRLYKVFFHTSNQQVLNKLSQMLQGYGNLTLQMLQAASMWFGYFIFWKPIIRYNSQRLIYLSIVNYLGHS